MLKRALETTKSIFVDLYLVLRGPEEMTFIEVMVLILAGYIMLRRSFINEETYRFWEIMRMFVFYLVSISLLVYHWHITYIEAISCLKRAKRTESSTLTRFSEERITWMWVNVEILMVVVGTAVAALVVGYHPSGIKLLMWVLLPTYMFRVIVMMRCRSRQQRALKK